MNTGGGGGGCCGNYGNNVSKQEVLIIGEIIHLRMQKHPLLIKDRRHHLRTHSCCFIGREVCEWLIKSGEAVNESDAVSCMRVLQTEGVIHHVSDDHSFKNDNLFYRFRIDDGTFFVDTDFEAYHQAIMVHQRILGDGENLIIGRNSVSGGDDDNDKTYENTFTGAQFANWLFTNDIVRDRYASVILAQHFLDLLLIKAVANEATAFAAEANTFYDNDTLYRFIFDVDFNVPLYQVFNIGDGGVVGGGENRVKSASSVPTTVGIPSSEKSFCSLTLQENNGGKLLSKFWKEGTWGASDDSDVESKEIVEDRGNDEETLPTLKPVVFREVTVEELTNKESAYCSKNITITSDSVGFGFIVRGNGPCYVQAVDPTSPAAEAGLKVRMYLHSVNGKVVLNMGQDELGKEIVRRPVVDLVVLQNLRSSH